MTVEITGTVKAVGTTEQVSEKFKKRDLVLTIDEATEYPQFIPIQATQDNCVKLDEIRVGYNVTVSANFRGNEYKEKFYLSLQLWKFNINQTSGTPTQQAPASVEEDPDQDLPF